MIKISPLKNALEGSFGEDGEMKKNASCLCFLLIGVCLFPFLGSAEEHPAKTPSQPVLTSKTKQKDSGYVMTFYINGKEVATQEFDKDVKLLKTTGKIPDGTIKQYNVNGKLFAETDYKNGRMNGVKKSFFDNGKLYMESSMSDDLVNGLSKEYYPNGHIKDEVNCLNGKVEGLQKLYDDNGKLSGVLTNHEGQLNGPSTVYYPDGKINVTSNYKDGQQDGTYTHYYRNGQVNEKVDFVEGQKDGVDQVFNEDGSPAYSTTYQSEAKQNQEAEKEDQEFKAVVKKYRSSKTKPKLPPEARKYAVQAADAVDQKRFDVAAGLYEQALYQAPWWPQGYYNEAEILAEDGKYDEAAEEMKKYLMLEPHAKDAQAAQDEISKWEGRMGK